MRWSDFESLARLAGRLLHDNTSATKTAAIRTTSQAPTARPAAGTGQPAADFDGLPEMRYQAKGPGGFASGQIVWTWIAYEEDPSQGKDRPVLLFGAHSGWLLGLPATSQDHDRDAEQERRAGRYWVEIGSGEWDKQRRVSEVRTDRIVRIDPAYVRRASGSVSAAVFQKVAAEVREHWDD